jgi:hypothetical protein
MPVKSDALSILAEKMVQTLRQRKERGESDIPLALEQLGKLADPTAMAPTILRAAAPSRKAFKVHAIAARQALDAPVVLHEDVPHLVASPVLLHFALGCARTPANHAVSVAEMKRKLTSKLQSAFQEAVQRRIVEDALPPGIGWLLIKNSKKLFFLTDLHPGRTHTENAAKLRPEPQSGDTSAQARIAECSAPVTLPPPGIESDFDTVFARLDRQAGGHNFVSLVDLRRELPLGRTAFDTELRQMRLAGRYTLSAAEGRHGLSTTELEAGIVEDGTLLLYISRKSP